jgi:D-sedoheptulose 7-phosphate isomerase
MKQLSPAFSMREHLAALFRPLADLEGELERIEAWGRELAHVLAGGGRLLAAGNGGSAAQAQHLATELVGRFGDDARPPLSAIALCADMPSVTAIGNDFGAEEAFARQVRAHGRPGDVLVALSTSGRSANVLAAVEEARRGEVTAWALTGRAPNALADAADDFLAVASDRSATVQEVHQVVLHLLCGVVDAEVMR